MANPTWPSSVPGPELDSIRYAPAFDNHLRANVGYGGKTRRAATAVPEIVTFNVYPTHAQLQTLLDFYTVTLLEVGAFDWYDWRKPNDTDQLATFTFKSRPRETPWGRDLAMVIPTVFNEQPPDNEVLGPVLSTSGLVIPGVTFFPPQIWKGLYSTVLDATQSLGWLDVLGMALVVGAGIGAVRMEARPRP